MYAVILICNLSSPWNCLEVKFPLQSEISICGGTAIAEIAEYMSERPNYQVRRWGCTRGPRWAKAAGDSQWNRF